MATKNTEKVPFSPERRTYQGGCRCGAVRWEAELDLSAGTGMCNCTACSKTGWWGVILKPEDFRLLSGEEQLLTIWSKPQADHRICRKCGVHSFGQGHIPEIGGDYVGLNVRCIEGTDLNGVPVAYRDGLHDTWALIRTAPYTDPFAMGMNETDSGWKLPWDGGCRCGGVRLRVTQPPLLSMACHCKGCQRMSSSAFSLSLAVPTSGFEILAGEPVVGGLHGPSQHMFCGHCMTWMYTRPEGMDFFVNLRPTMLDDAGWFVPFIETHTKERLPWAQTPAVHSFGTIPEMSAFEGLIQEFASRGARPS